MLNLILKNMLRTVVCCTCLYASGSPAQAQISYHLHILRAGHMMGIFSLDQSSSSNNGLFLTVANVAGTFYPGRRVGVSYTYAAPQIYASAGVFCGDGLNSDPKVSPGVNATGRLVYRPFHEEGKLLHIGSGAFFKKPDRIQELGRTIELSNTGNTSLPAPTYSASFWTTYGNNGNGT